MRAISFTVVPASQKRVGVGTSSMPVSGVAVDKGDVGVAVDIGEVSVAHDKTNKAIPVSRYFLILEVLLGII